MVPIHLFLKPHLAVVSVLILNAIDFLQQVGEAIHKQLLLEGFEGEAIAVLLHHGKGGVGLPGLCRVKKGLNTEQWASC